MAATLTVADAQADTLKVEAGKPFELTCETRAVVVATGAANATTGTIALKISPAADNARKGTWTVTDAGKAHSGGFATRQKEACAKGCPFDVSAKGETQLWAPGPKSLDRLAEDESLLIAVIKPKGLALRASSFRGKDIEALEEGQCKVKP